MRVEHASDRMSQPEECDNCGTPQVPLTRYSSYGPGNQVSWHCCYCSSDYTGGDDIVRTVAAMLHILENRLKDSQK